MIPYNGSHLYDCKAKKAIAKTEEYDSHDYWTDWMFYHVAINIAQESRFGEVSKQ